MSKSVNGNGTERRSETKRKCSGRSVTGAEVSREKSILRAKVCIVSGSKSVGKRSMVGEVLRSGSVKSKA